MAFGRPTDIEKIAARLEHGVCKDTKNSMLYRRKVAFLVQEIKNNTKEEVLHSSFQDFQPSSTLLSSSQRNLSGPSTKDTAKKNTKRKEVKSRTTKKNKSIKDFFDRDDDKKEDASLETFEIFNYEDKDLTKNEDDVVDTENRSDVIVVNACDVNKVSFVTASSLLRKAKSSETCATQSKNIEESNRNIEDNVNISNSCCENSIKTRTSNDQTCEDYISPNTSTDISETDLNHTQTVDKPFVIEVVKKKRNVTFEELEVAESKRLRLSLTTKELEESELVTVAVNIKPSCKVASLSKTRIAEIVNTYLYPYYKSGNIISKDLFKVIARKISQRVALKDETNVRNEVKRITKCLFSGGRKVSTSVEIDNI